MMRPGAPRFDVAARIPGGVSERRVPEMLQSLLSDRFKLTCHRGKNYGMVYALVLAKGGLKLVGETAQTDAGVSPVAAEPDVQPVDGFFGEVRTRTTADLNGHAPASLISSPRIGTVRETGDPFHVQRWEASGISLEGLADLLDTVAPLSSPVVDMTGVKGRFQMVLEVSLREARPGSVRIAADSTAGDTPGTEMEAAVLTAFNDGLRKLGLKLTRRRGAVEAIVVDHVEKSPTEN